MAQTPILGADFDKGVTNYVDLFDSMFMDAVSHSSIFPSLIIHHVGGDAQSYNRRSRRFGGSVSNRGGEQDANFSKARDWQESLVIDIPYQRGYEYNPGQESIWGGDPYKTAAAMATDFTKGVMKNVEHKAIEEAFNEAPTLSDSVETLNAATATENVSAFLIDWGEIVRQDATKKDDAPVDMYTSSEITNHIVKAVRKTENSFGAFIQGGGLKLNVYGGLTHSTHSTPIRFGLELTTSPVAGEKLVLFRYHQYFAIEFVASSTTIGKDDVNKVKLGTGNAAAALTKVNKNLARFFQADNGVFSNTDGYSRKSFILEGDLQKNPGGYQTFREAQELTFASKDKNDKFVTKTTANDPKIETDGSFEVQAYGVNSVFSTPKWLPAGTNTSVTGVVAVTNVSFGILFICDNCVDFKMGEKHTLVESPSQVDPNNLWIVKGNAFGYYGVKLFADNKHYVKTVWVKKGTV